MSETRYPRIDRVVDLACHLYVFGASEDQIASAMYAEMLDLGLNPVGQVLEVVSQEPLPGPAVPPSDERMRAQPVTAFLRTVDPNGRGVILCVANDPTTHRVRLAVVHTNAEVAEFIWYCRAGEDMGPFIAALSVAIDAIDANILRVQDVIELGLDDYRARSWRLPTC